jgi:hypothetical protein
MLPPSSNTKKGFPPVTEDLQNLTRSMHLFCNNDHCYLQFNSRVLLEQWIKAKYERHEFSHPENQVYTSGYMKGFLMKRGKDDNKYHPRMFILEEKDGTLRYFVKEVCS